MGFKFNIQGLENQKEVQLKIWSKNLNFQLPTYISLKRMNIFA